MNGLRGRKRMRIKNLNETEIVKLELRLGRIAQMTENYNRARNDMDYCNKELEKLHEEIREMMK